MIKDRAIQFSPSFLPQANGVSPAPSFTVSGAAPQAQGSGNSVYGPTDKASLSEEAGQPEADGALSPLLQGLQSWGSPGGQEQGASQEKVGQQTQGVAQPTQGAAATGQGQIPSQVPVAILNQVLNTLKTAGGMATVGALQSLLQWGSSELEKDGKLRPEFKEILREAIDFAKEKRIMSPEDLAQYESRLLSEGQGQGGGAGKSEGEGGCPCHKGKGVKESLQAAQAA